ncbi:histidinol-phosphate transaminase [Actinocrispum wychmicini]|uniref:histidinol-phosphate transaminase n=1 Tax=Actinocrispum wychmicini TaxID=1213861 RepID=UPI001404F16A|nr:histidinol-phosphate transaminase [Actinocrispum wychmicini]
MAGKTADALRRELGVDTVVKLGSNESPIGPSERAVAAAGRAARTGHIYPGIELTDLAAAVGRHVGLGPDAVVIGNGSCDVLLAVAAELLGPGDEAVVPEPSFAMYRIGAEAAGARVVSVPHCDYAFDQDGILDAVTERTRLLFLTNPNNPTGLALSRTEIVTLLDALPPWVVVVLDEAYGEFVDPESRVDGVEFLREGCRVVVTRTFSKIYALAAFRVGYGLASPTLAGALRAAQPPFHVGSVALRAAQAALGDTDHIELSQRVNREGRAYLTGRLTALGFRVLPSQANHVLVVGLHDVQSLDAALNRQGVITRPTGPSFGLDGGLRITVGTREQNERVVAVLSDWLSGS